MWVAVSRSYNMDVDFDDRKPHVVSKSHNRSFEDSFASLCSRTEIEARCDMTILPVLWHRSRALGRPEDGACSAVL